MRNFTKLLAVAWFTVMGVWLAGRTGFLDLPKDTSDSLHFTWVVLMMIKLYFDFRYRPIENSDKDPGEPPQAVILTILIILTGGAGVVAAIKSGPDASTIVPWSIGICTVMLACLGYTLASRHKNEIGEARFKSPSDQA